MSKTKFIKSISELTKETAERIKDGKIVAKSNDPKVQKAIEKKVDDLTGIPETSSDQQTQKLFMIEPVLYSYWESLKFSLMSKMRINRKLDIATGAAKRGFGKAYMKGKR